MLQLLTLLLVICVWFQQTRQNPRRQVCHFSAPRECVYKVKKQQQYSVPRCQHKALYCDKAYFPLQYSIPEIRPGKKTCFCIILLVQQEAAFTSCFHLDPQVCSPREVHCCWITLRAVTHWRLATVPYKSWTGQGWSNLLLQYKKQFFRSWAACAHVLNHELFCQFKPQ